MVKVYVFDRNVRFLKLMKKLSAGNQINVLGIVSSVLFVQKSLSKIVRAKWMTKTMVRGILQHVFAKKKKKKSQISSRKVKW